MVKNRLNRESNPLPGTTPGYNPQYIENDGNATDVTPATPLPSTDANVLSKLADLETKIQATNDKLDGTINTQLIGSIEEGINVNQIKSGIKVVEKRVAIGEKIDAGVSKEFNVFANVGEVWTLQRLGYDVTKSSTSTGKPRISLYHGLLGRDDNFITLIEFKEENQEYLRGTIPGVRQESRTGIIIPSTNQELVDSVRGTTILSDDLPLTIKIQNRSDVELTVESMNLIFKAERVVQ